MTVATDNAHYRNKTSASANGQPSGKTSSIISRRFTESPEFVQPNFKGSPPSVGADFAPTQRGKLLLRHEATQSHVERLEMLRASIRCEFVQRHFAAAAASLSANSRSARPLPEHLQGRSGPWEYQNAGPSVTDILGHFSNGAGNHRSPRIIASAATLANDSATSKEPLHSARGRFAFEHGPAQVTQ